MIYASAGHGVILPTFAQKRKTEEIKTVVMYARDESVYVDVGFVEKRKAKMCEGVERLWGGYIIEKPHPATDEVGVDYYVIQQLMFGLIVVADIRVDVVRFRRLNTI